MIAQKARLFSLTLFTLISTFIFAQNFDRIQPLVIVNEDTLNLAFSGGMNAPQLNAVDLDNDGIEDLVLFDRDGNTLLPIKVTKQANKIEYEHRADLIRYFPPLYSWLVLKDFNGDSVVDIFTYSKNEQISGIEVFRGSYENNLLHFEKMYFPNQAKDALYFNESTGNGAQIYVTVEDIPAIADMDGDGDLDILTFNAGGGFLELYKNRSLESGFGLDTLIYDLTDPCWGGIYESGISLSLDLSPNINVCDPQFSPENWNIDIRHTGSTVSVFDINDDCALEVFLGDISFNNVVMGYNGGTCNKAWISSQDTFFPVNTTSTIINDFPATFFIDIDKDGLKDYIATKNMSMGGLDFDNCWMYKNVGSTDSAIFEFQQNDFLVGEMIDIGTATHPKFVDYNADGLMDMVVGNENKYIDGGSAKDSRLFLFENKGSIQTPLFELVDTNWLDFRRFLPVTGSSSGAYSFVPEFGDLDNDGDLDLLVGCNNGTLFFAENFGGIDAPLSFGTIIPEWKNIDVGTNSAPAIGDINKDGLPDLVIGEYNVRLNYFENIGSATEPEYDTDVTISPNSPYFGQIDLREGYDFFLGYGTPKIISTNDSLFLLTGHESGTVWLFSDISNPSDAFKLIDSNFGNTKEGIKNAMDLADIDNDGFFEMIVGNNRGGLGLFNTTMRTNGILSSTSDKGNSLNQKVLLYPNPANNCISIDNKNHRNPIISIEMYNMIGNLVAALPYKAGELIDIRFMSKGVYLLKTIHKTGYTTQKFVKL